MDDKKSESKTFVAKCVLCDGWHDILIAVKAKNKKEALEIISNSKDKGLYVSDLDKVDIEFSIREVDNKEIVFLYRDC